MRTQAWLIAATLLGVSAAAAGTLTRTTDPRWLTGADEKMRFERLEHYLGGFSSAMQETGLRYGHVRQAIVDGNLELARYHWGKIAAAIENGLMKRPARRLSAEAIFLGRAWETLDEALAKKDPGAATEAFQEARAACMACHVAERVPFMNDQPLFRE